MALSARKTFKASGLRAAQRTVAGPPPRTVNTKDLQISNQTPHGLKGPEPSDESPSFVGELPDLDGIRKEELLQMIEKLKTKKRRHLGHQSKRKSKPQNSTEGVDKLVVRRKAIPSTPPAPTPSPLTATPPRPTPAPLTSPEKEPTREELFKMSDDEFHQWVVEKSREWVVNPGSVPSSSYIDNWLHHVIYSGEQPALDAPNEGNSVPSVEEVSPPKTQHTANLFSDNDMEAARRGYIELNGQQYDINEESLSNMKACGLYVDGLRAALYQVRIEKLEAKASACSTHQPE
ncbi:hypothetical protein EYR41_002893 [Orbilia oligospora]|uniref:Uncharacterized protein n=1 Tax=Orbilia oligospora TaxID=2813651 RepID=A0A7C8KJC3_ORBOL|nr:hypothetical protein TWF751_004785 [Orbilia oligospora]TGJ70877.1 hypothetical protein EYR41_002893 [Orbilia oligospora]